MCVVSGSEFVHGRCALRLLRGGVVAYSFAVLFTDHKMFLPVTGAVIFGIDDTLSSRLVRKVGMWFLARKPPSYFCFIRSITGGFLHDQAL